MKIINECFPSSNPLHKIFNKSSLKLSYSCLPNIGTSLLGLVNRKTYEHIQSLHPKPIRPDCIHKTEQDCPAGRKCNLLDNIYRAEIVHDTSGKTENYIGMCAGTFRQGLAIHKHSFKVHSDNQTELSERIIQLEKQGEKFDIKFSILENKKSYDNASRQCSVCTAEKFQILKSKLPNIINKRSEITGKCHHRARYKLK